MARSSSGFTLIELLVVVLIIGVLAAIAVPRYSSVKVKTNVTTLKTDLRNLVTTQEAYLADAGTYYNGPVPGAGLPFTASAGVTLTVTEASTAGWAATATHAGAPGWTCAVFVGGATPPAPAIDDGLIACQGS
jgi:prepilin-type N-terminal cleavage/methylation domain-containing protein